MMRKSLALAAITLLLVACAASGWQGMAGQAARAGTAVAEGSGSLLSTSESVVSTAVVTGQTAGPPLMTRVAQAMTQAVGRAEPVVKASLFANPHEGFMLISRCGYGSYNCSVKAPHTGIDSAADPQQYPSELPVPVLAAGPGIISRIQYLAKGCSREHGDCGLGNVVILEHTLLNGSRIYSLYAHLDTINANLTVGGCLPKGAPLGTMGTSGFGDRNYWENRHLHLEFKTAPVLGDPRSFSASPTDFPEGQYFGYLTDAVDPAPDHWGYRNPLSFLNEMQARACGS